MSLADEVLAEQRTYNEWREGGFCSKCKEAFPCSAVRLATKLKAAEQVVEAYSGHRPDCERQLMRTLRCECGYEAALAEYDKEGQG